MEASFQGTLHRIGRPVRFGLVGVSGAVLNSAIVWALVQSLHLAIPAASALATEAAIVSNFLLNDRWTFASAQRGGARARFARFNGVALGGMVITAGVLTLLIHYARAELLPANLAAIGVATIWNYLVNSRWTWGGQQSAVGSRQSAVRDAALVPTADCRLATGEEAPL